MPLRQRTHFRLLFLIMATASLIVSATSVFSLYQAAIGQHGQRLIETAKSQALLIESIARFDALKNPQNNLESRRAETLAQVAEAHLQFSGFGDSGEFLLARQQQNRVVILLKRGQENINSTESMPLEVEWAEPIRRALAGESGLMSGLDYRGVQVLAAYEPLPKLELALLAKIDSEEIRAPFVIAGLIAILIAVCIIFVASLFFFRIARPMSESIEQQAETFTTLVETIRQGIILSDTNGIIEFVNPAAEKLFGYQSGELPGQKLNILMPGEHSRAHDGYINNYLNSGIGKIIGIGRKLTALRKNGSRFPIYLSIGDIKLSHKRLFAGVIMDISEEQQLQREILEIPVNEQRRIGHELHDGLGQQLTGLGMLATSLVNKAGKPEHELATRLAAGLQEAIAQVRALARGLMPVDIDSAGLMLSLENLIEEISAQSGISIEFSIDNEILVSDNNVALHLYRIAQEGLNNAFKHADASEIQVNLGISDSLGLLSIRDNGRGIADDNGDVEGLGLRIMKHRCGLIDALLRIHSSPGNGTEIQCLFPLSSGEVL